MQLNDQLLSQIEQALLSLTAPNTTIVRQGEKYLKEFMKNQIAIERLNSTEIEKDVIKNFLPTPD